MFIFFDSENTSYSNENINESVENTQSLFDSIRHINEFGQEFWYARELSKVLMYHDFRNFELTMTKAMEACKNSGHEISDHFGEVTEMVSIGSGAKRGFPSICCDVFQADRMEAMKSTHFKRCVMYLDLLENYVT